MSDYTETEILAILNKITTAQASTITMNDGELYLAPDNAVYSVNNTAPVNGNVTIDVANKDLSNLSTTGNAKFQASITGGASTITSSNLTADKALISNARGKVAVSSVTSSELGYLLGVTSNVQTQLNRKQATLVSGTNIKTINNTSILGSGNIITGTTVTTDANSPALTPTDGLVTWSFANPANNAKVAVDVVETATGKVVDTQKIITASIITISFLSTNNLSAGAYKAIITG